MAKGFGYYLPIEQAKGRFYMRAHFSKNFAELTEERLEEIKKDAIKYVNEHSIEYNKKTTFLKRPISLYTDVIFYLTNPCINDTYPTFDEKMAFLIQVIDPEYKIAKMYLQSTLLTAYEQKNLKPEDGEKRRKHIDERNILFHQTENMFGFTDPTFVQMERIFFNRFGLQKELLSNIQGNYIEELFSKSIVVRSYNRTTEEEFEEANHIAQNLIALQSDITNPNTVAFNILKQNKLLGGNGTLKQAYLIFILAFDPELKMLQIYYDESMVPKMEARANEELGFYERELIRLEQEYHQRFEPEKIVSVWQI